MLAMGDHDRTEDVVHMLQHSYIGHIFSVVVARGGRLYGLGHLNTLGNRIDSAPPIAGTSRDMELQRHHLVVGGGGV